MEPFNTHTGIVATLDRANVDTDQIIPKQFLKRIERTGFGQFLFFDWRFHDDGDHNAEFELNHPHHDGASILLTRRNFGSGSSREHAVWALSDYGFRVVIAPSFADIFFNNCFKNGLLPITLAENEIDELFSKFSGTDKNHLEVDLGEQTVKHHSGSVWEFDIDESRKHNLVHGLDDIALTLQHADRIAEFESKR